MAKLKWSKYIPHKPTKKQIKALLNFQKELLYGGALGGGKLVGIDDYLLTPTGFKLNTELNVGDDIIGSDGKAQKIIQWKGWETLPVYRVKFHDGSYLDVPKEHLWSAWRSGRSRKVNGQRLHGESSQQVVSTEKLLEWHKTAKRTQGKCIQTPWVLIPTVAPCHFGERWNAPIPAYLFGALLGDGYIADPNGLKITFTCSADDFSHWVSEFKYYNYSVDTKHDGNKTIRILGKDRIEFCSWLQQHGLYGCKSHNKFIPNELLNSDLISRINLLQGLIDTDGYIDERGQVYFCSISTQLRKDVTWLVQSLGGTATEFDENELYLKFPEGIIPARIPRKRNRYKQQNCSMYRRVKSIRKLNKPKTGRCITVSNSDGLYVTNSFILTHNSDLLLMCCLQYMDVPGYAAGIFRRSLTDLKLPGALLDRARSWLAPFTGKNVPSALRVRWIASEHAYHFPCFDSDGNPDEPAKLVFCYCNETNAKDRYQSAEFQTICFDELSHWDMSNDYEYMLTRLRRTVCKLHGEKINKTTGEAEPNWVKGCPECNTKRNSPVRMRAATNPGGLGGQWIKRYFQIIPDPNLYPDKRDAIMAIMNGIKVPFVGTHPERAFVPAFITDNPFLDKKDYDQFLSNLPDELRSALRDGNWEARVDSRFKRGWIKYYNLFDDGIQLGRTLHNFNYFEKIFITVDPAGTVKEGITDSHFNKKGPSYTVASVWGQTKNKELFYLDMIRFRQEIPDIVIDIIDLYKKWKSIWPSIYLKIETNGIGLGPAQYMRRLGVPIKNCQKSKDKIENSTAAMLLMKAGMVYFPNNAPWIDEAEDEIFAWSGLPTETDDIIDTLSDAAIEVGPVEKTTYSDDEEKKVPIKNYFSYSHVVPNLIGSLNSERKYNPFKHLK